MTEVVPAFEAAVRDNKVIMICLNATHVPGEREEPAAHAPNG